MKIFGSCATGLALATSDVDVSVSGLELYMKTGQEYLSLMNDLFKKFKWTVSNKPILTAHVPVLKLVNLISLT
jgi:DNA polymerase sigma